MRTSDVFPTALRLLGKEPPEGIDGVARAWEHIPAGEN
jgi:hypothetical protein